MALSGPGLALCSLFTLYFGECAFVPSIEQNIEKKSRFQNAP